jgi:hypothetical protein
MCVNINIQRSQRSEPPHLPPAVELIYREKDVFGAGFARE